MEYENKETTMLSDGRYLVDHTTEEGWISVREEG